MSMKVRVTGDHIDLADELEEEFKAVAKETVREAASVLLAQVQDNLRRRSGPEPAPPGEPPARQTGKLLRSWKLSPVWVGRRAVACSVRSNHPAAWVLEYGAVVNTAAKIAAELRAAARLDPSALGPKGGLRQSRMRAIREEAERESAVRGERQRQEPRPYIRPAEVKSEPKITTLFEQRFGGTST